MTKFSFLFIIAFSATNISAQFYDNHWMMGYFGGSESSPTDSFGVSILSFYDGELRVEDNQEIDLFFDGSGSSMSSYDGDIFIYSNNLEVRNSNDQLIINGRFEDVGDAEQIRPQSFTCLPFSEDNLFYHIQMIYTNGSPRLGKEVSAHIIDNNNELGIYESIDYILSDSLNTSQLTACRHANGRDWWVLVASAQKPLVYSMLISPSGITQVDTLEVAFEMQNGLGQCVFSPDGNKYVQINLVEIDAPDFLDVFDFDRATGQLSNHKQTTLGPNAFAGGVAVSSSSQFLYVSHYNHIFQYDLWAEDIFATKDTVAIYDGYQELGFFSTRFFLSQLAPDGKIYINCPSGVRKLHVIEFPDKRGIDCDVRQHSVSLPNFNSFTLANHPNYRLGPIDGSLADSLNFDNFPRAYFRTDRSTEDTLGFHFQDLSFYEPDSWSWTFGDGSISTDRHPDHTYSSPGIYEVCLTVSNDLGTDTKCRELELGPSSIGDPQNIKVTTFPNPLQDVLIFDLGDYYPLNGHFTLFDAAGREVFSKRILYRQAQFDLSRLSEGIYHYSFWDGGMQLSKGKLVKSR